MTRPLPPRDGHLPEGFYYIDEWIGDCLLDAKYAGSDNFMGRPSTGYERALVVVSRPVRDGLIRAAELARAQGLCLLLFDSYRPQRAVDDFCRWGADMGDQQRKAIHYPNIEKARMFTDRYIARRSSHTRGSAVDLTLADAATGQALDMGTCFDYMDTQSWPGSPDVTPEQRQNRMRLREFMCASGFVPYEREWWHFSVSPEPYPGEYFDFPIR